MGNFGRVIVEVSLTGMELGICTVYFNYIATNIGASLGGEYNTDAGHRRIMLMLLPILALFGLITRMSVVAKMSAVANVIMAAALIIVWFYLSERVVEHGPEHGTFAPEANEIHKLLLTLATIIYSFEGCGAVLPIENSMASPQKFHNVLWVSFATFFFVYTLMGVLGALAFDFEVAGMVKDDRGSVSAVIAFYYQSGADATVGKVLNLLLAVTVAMTYVPALTCTDRSLGI
jgi:proton-coupled amino acid transporter